MNEISKKNINFIFRLANLLFIVVLIFYYNQIIFLQKELEKANKTIEEAATMQINSQTNSNIEETEKMTQYKDGIYEGEGEGFGGTIFLKVEVAEGKINKIEVVSAEKEDGAYFDMAKSLLDTIVTEQSTEIDVVSGATFSSKGILEAVEDALEKAVVE